MRGAAPAMAAMVAEVERMVKGERTPPRELWPKLAKRFTLIGVQGIVRMALAGFDAAYWDALARARASRSSNSLGASAGRSRLQQLRSRTHGHRGAREGGRRAPRGGFAA
jgi:L-alanine-DL-glutamate epimerase-like enolase superfamily enzyme